ncbi:MAG: VWA domain-containing protein [Micromonosporaceae bacterium]|nr:VWA domain-containing protein [Micromonosporaceae bacterium]
MRRRRDAVNVRSHRRGGRRRRLVIAPWLVISVVSALLLSGVSAGYTWLAYSGCSGPEVRATVVSSPAMTRILDHLGRRWADTEPAVKGRCAAVKVVSKNSAEVAQALGPSWDPRRDGPEPHVWVPDSTAWLKLASARKEAARLIPDRQPSLARTPTVIAMPAPMAEAIGWPDAEMSWKRLGTELTDDDAAKRAWADNGHPEWGRFKIGMTNPVTSTAGLHALIAIADRDDDGRITAEERSPLVGLSRTMNVYAEDTSKIIGDLTKLDSGGEDKVLPYLSAFPILEHDLWIYNDSKPKVPLAAVYPTDGSADADYPYLTLDAPWSSSAERQAAKQFLRFARGPEGRQVFLDNAFRDPNREASKALSGDNGALPELRTLPRAVLTPDSVSLTTASWVASNRPTNVLFVIDVSASMTKPVRGADAERITLVRQSASNAVSLMGDKAHVGLWAFSAGLNGDTDHLELTRPGPLGSELEGQKRRDAVQDDLAALTAGGADAAGVHDTAVAAYQSLGKRHLKNAANLVVLITDGADDKAGLSLEKAVKELRAAQDPKRPARLIAIGYGAQADMAALSELAAAGGGRSHHVEYETDISSMLITALFNA